MLCFGLLLCSLFCLGQEREYCFQRIGKQDGLSHNEITAIFQDHSGYMWIGTWDGICRFDGYTIECMHQDSRDSSSLPADEVNVILENRAGDLFLGTRMGVALLPRGAGNRFRQIGTTSVRRGMLLDDQTLLGVSGGHNYHSTDIFLVSADGTPACPVRHAGKPGKKPRFSEFFRYDSLLWIGTDSGLYTYQPHLQAVSIPDHPLARYFAGQKIDAAARTPSGVQFIAAEEHLYRLTDGSNAIAPIRYDLPWRAAPAPITCLLADRHGSIWVGTKDGLFQFFPESERWRRFQHLPQDPYSLSDNHVSCLYEDRSGVLWIGTQTGGLNRLQRAEQTFHNVRTINSDLPADTKVFAFAAQNDTNLWIGTSKGLFLYDRFRRRFLTHDSIPPTPAPHAEARTILSIFQKDDGKLLIGTRHLGLYEYHPGTRKFQPINDLWNSDWYLFHPLRKIHRDFDGVYWIVGAGAIFWWAPGDTGWCYTRQPSGHPNMLKSAYLWDVVSYRRDEFWILGNRGLHRWVTGDSARTQTFENLAALPEISRIPLCAHLYRDSVMLFGTYGDGLLRFDVGRYFRDSTATEGHRRWTMADGLPNNYIYGLLEDTTDGSLWMSTNQGLSRFDTVAEVFSNFGPLDGVLIEEFESNSYLRCADGEMFFGGKGGFVSFFPVNSTGMQAALHPTLTSFSVIGGPSQAPSGWSRGVPIRLDNEQNTFEIRFSAMDYANTSKILYRYRLRPIEDWNTFSPSPQTRYTDLFPDTYTFELQARRMDDTTTFTMPPQIIDIIPAWHQRTRNRVFLVLLAVFIAGIIVFQRIRFVRERGRRLLEATHRELETEALRASINHHFTFNSLNSIQSFVSRADKEAAMRYIARFGQLIRMTLESRSGTFHSLAHEIEMLRLYLDLEALRTAGKFNTYIQLAPEIDPEHLLVPAMLVQPFLENAIWHGLAPARRTGKLHIRFSMGPQGLHCTVEDDGIGRAAAEANKAASSYRYESKGLRLIENRLKLLQRDGGPAYRYTFTDLFDADGLAAGTRVDLYMPHQSESL